MPVSKTTSAIPFFLSLFLLAGCSKKQTESPIPIQVDTSLYHKVDSITSSESKTVLRDTILTIKADSVNALYYPNTGKVVMKLKAGDVCKITRKGRYDVVDGKGNFWIRVERFGGKGWIFGGQTSLESDVWVFPEGMTEDGHPYVKYKLNKLFAPNFSNLFQLAGKAIKGAEYSESEDEPGNRKVDLSDDAVVVHESGIGNSTITETFKPGPANDSIQSIIYQYQEEGDNNVTFNHSFIIARKGAHFSFVTDFFGELKEIHRVGKNFLFTADYDLLSGQLGNVHYTNVEIWSSQKKSIISRQRFANTAVEPAGYPIFKRWDDGSFISSAKCTFSEVDDKLNMEIFETYNRVSEKSSVEEKVFYVTRYFTFNQTTYRFEESKQEVIYQEK